MAELRLGIAGAGIAALQVLPNLKELAGQVSRAALADVRASAGRHEPAFPAAAVP